MAIGSGRSEREEERSMVVEARRRKDALMLEILRRGCDTPLE